MNCKIQTDYQECSTMCFSETWLQDLIINCVSLLNCLTTQADRDLKRRRKSKEGGLSSAREQQIVSSMTCYCEVSFELSKFLSTSFTLVSFCELFTSLCQLLQTMHLMSSVQLLTTDTPLQCVCGNIC